MESEMTINISVEEALLWVETNPTDISTILAAEVRRQHQEIERLRADVLRKQKLIDDAEQVIGRQREERLRLRAAISELVACKDLKDEVLMARSDPYYSTHADQLEQQYKNRRTKAWAAAREALARSKT